ncbi:MAG: hypothetical protein HY261_04545 [Chloroflexi bacterium]|nr:hypothetical protein [Chloroflexota bacterium]
MSNPSPPEQLSERLAAAATSAGLELVAAAPGRVEGEVESIRAKWLLGKRTVRYRMACTLDENTRTATFRESLVERTSGIAPPTFSFQKTSQKRTRVQVERRDVSVGGGGVVSFGALRQRFEQIVREAGWRFELQARRLP